MHARPLADQRRATLALRMEVVLLLMLTYAGTRYLSDKTPSGSGTGSVLSHPPGGWSPVA